MSSNTPAPRLSAGDRVAGGSDLESRGRVGAILTRAHDQTLFLVTARHVVHEGRVVFENGIPVGLDHGFPDEQSLVEGVPDISASLAFIRILPTVFVCPESARSYQVVSPHNLLGKKVSNTARTSDATGTLVAFGLPLHLRHRAADVVRHYNGALQVGTSLLADLPFAGPGDSGAAVVESDNSIVGFILGGVRGAVFLAPASCALRNGEFRFASRSEIGVHNSSVLDNRPRKLETGKGKRRARRDVAVAASGDQDWSTTDDFASRLKNSNPLYEPMVQV